MPNNNIVNFQRLKEVLEDLWNKAKGKFVTNITYELPDRKLVQEKNGVTNDIVSGLVSRWEHLEHVKEYDIVNVLDITKAQAGKGLSTNGDIIASSKTTGIVEFNVIPDETYTILRQRAWAAKIRFELSDGNISSIDAGTTISNGYHRHTFSVPSNTVKAFYELQLDHPNIHEEMILQGNHMQTNIANYIPYADEKLIQVSNVSLSFDNSDTKIKSTTVESAIKELSSSTITKWGDLKHVTEYPHTNLLNYSTKVTGHYSGSNNNEVWTENPDWSTCFIDVEEGQAYSVYRRNNDTHRIILTNNIKGNKIDALNISTSNNIAGFEGGYFTIPTNRNITKIAVQFQHDVNGQDDIMVFKDNVANFTDFIPYMEGNSIQIGKEVWYEFDNTGTNIQSTTVHGAIKELSNLNDNFITKWEDLDHVTRYPYANLIDYGKKITGYWYGNNGGEHHIPNTFWSIYELPVKPNGIYTIFRKNATLDSSRYEFFNDDTHIETRQVQNATHDGWHKQVIQVPHNVNKVGMCFQHNLNSEDSLMAIEGDLSNISVNFIPYIDGQLLQIGNELSLKFDNTGTNINSKTISSAIKELSNRSIDSVTSWGDLKYTEEHPYVNILDYSKRLNGKWYGTSADGTQTDNTRWSIYELPVVEGKTYTISRRSNDDHRYYFFQDNTFVSYEDISYAGYNGWLCDVVTIPTGRNINKMGLQFQHGMNPQTSLMVFEGRSYPTSDKFTPFLNGVHVIIGTEVIHQFDNAGTNLNSTYVHDAIKELNTKITNAGSGTVTKVNGVLPNLQGEVELTLANGLQEVQTALNLKMNITDADNKFIPKTDAIDTSNGQSDSGKVVKLSGDGKISSSMIPKIAINEVRTYDTKELAFQASQSGQITNGDVVVIKNDNNSIHMLADSSQNSFDTAFIELSLGAGVIKTIGGQTPNGTGDIPLSFSYGTDEYELKANSVKVASFPTMTETEKQEIINIFTQ